MSRLIEKIGADTFDILFIMFEVEISKRFRARQGLSSPVRLAQDLPTLAPKDGFTVILRVVVEFQDSQLNERGWFVDTDTLDETVGDYAQYLASSTWTILFDIPRPTFELIAKKTYEALRPNIKQLAYVELVNETLGVRTRYRGVHQKFGNHLPNN